jgi:hypothetical protein
VIRIPRKSRLSQRHKCSIQIMVRPFTCYHSNGKISGRALALKAGLAQPECSLVIHTILPSFALGCGARHSCMLVAAEGECTHKRRLTRRCNVSLALGLGVCDPLWSFRFPYHAACDHAGCEGNHLWTRFDQIGRGKEGRQE